MIPIISLTMILLVRLMIMFQLDDASKGIQPLSYIVLFLVIFIITPGTIYYFTKNKDYTNDINDLGSFTLFLVNNTDNINNNNNNNNNKFPILCVICVIYSIIIFCVTYVLFNRGMFSSSASAAAQRSVMGYISFYGLFYLFIERKGNK